MKILGCLAASAVWFASISHGYAVNITIQEIHNDKPFTGGNVGVAPGENDHMEYNATSHQTWDLERFDLSGNQLGLTGGFNYLTGTGDGSPMNYAMGDIYVYFGSQPCTGAANQKNDPWIGKDDWSYVIHFDRSTTGDPNIVETAPGSGRVSYDLVKSTDPGWTRHETGGSGSLILGLPWYLSEGVGAVAAGGGTAALTSYADGEGIHYTLGDIDVSDILADAGGQSVFFHATMRCGNDVIWGKVPDGGMTLTLLGISLVGIGLVRQTRRA